MFPLTPIADRACPMHKNYRSTAPGGRLVGSHRHSHKQGPPQQQQGGGTLNAATLAAAPPAVQKQMIGEKLYPAIARYQPELAGKISGMMLEMDNLSDLK